jgi:hypothetical protein
LDRQYTYWSVRIEGRIIGFSLIGSCSNYFRVSGEHRILLKVLKDAVAFFTPSDDNPKAISLLYKVSIDSHLVSQFGSAPCQLLVFAERPIHLNAPGLGAVIMTGCRRPISALGL